VSEISVNPTNSEAAQRPPLDTPDSKSAECIALPVLGMTCSACQHHVEEALRQSPGVLSAHVDLMRHRATVNFNPQITGPDGLVQAIRNSGYDAVLPRAEAASLSTSKHTAESGAGWKAALTILAGIAAMFFSMPLGMAMMNRLSEPDTMLQRIAPWLYELPQSPLRWTLLIVTALLSSWAGNQVYRSAWKALLHRETNMNTLVSLGTGVAFLYSAYVTLQPQRGENVYFDSVLLILGFLLLGKWLESRARHRALAAVDALAHLQPANARVQREESGKMVETLIPLDDLRVGDTVIILPGERIPADAVLISGRTTVDESMLTGESVPLTRTVGGQILAGSLNYDGAVSARVTSAGAQSTLAQIARLVDLAQSSRAPMERLADRASAIFVPVVLGVALLTFLGWLVIAHNLPFAIASTVAVLVIACPCAMGLAVPAALTVAIGRGAQFGVLIKGGDALERIAGLQSIAIDKTGTLTLGKPVLIGIVSLSSYSEQELLRLAASVEDHSAHTLAHAIVASAKELGLQWPTASNVQINPGRGVTAEVENRRCLLGNIELLKEESIRLPDPMPPAAAPGVTRLWLSIDNHLAGFFDAQDTLRPSAATAVRWLRNHGLQVEMLTGDSSSAADPIAASLGITQVCASLMPADKVSRIRAIQKDGTRVAMVGDGINDAAALAQSDAGMAMGAGAALAQEAGDILLLQSDPAAICTAIGLSRATITVMRQNLAWAGGYNLIGIPLAAGLFYPFFHIMLTPWMAAAAMAFSSVSVLLNSLRLRGWRAPLA
jgi:Cu+-exporting ATPase